MQFHNDEIKNYNIYNVLKVSSNQIAAQYKSPQPPQHQPLNGPSEYVPSAPGNTNYEDDRKFAEKSNAVKKVALDDIDEDIQTNQIQDNSNGFSWTNMLGTLMTMFFNNAANNVGPTKSDDLDAGFAPSPWANVISVGKLFFASHCVFF